MAWAKLIGSDKDSKALVNAQENSKAVGVSLELSEKDFRQIEMPAQQRLWICSNPPYGDRLKMDFTVQELVEGCLRLNPERMALLISKSGFEQLPKGLRPQKSLFFSNGGISVVLGLWSNAD